MSGNIFKINTTYWITRIKYFLWTRYIKQYVNNIIIMLAYSLPFYVLKPNQIQTTV